MENSHCLEESDKKRDIGVKECDGESQGECVGDSDGELVQLLKLVVHRLQAVLKQLLTIAVRRK